MCMSKRYCSIFVALFFLATGSSMAQVTWMHSYDNHGGSLEFRKGSGENFNDGVTSYALIANGHVRFSPNIMGIWQLPFSHANSQEDIEFFFGEFSGTIIGNPYFGIEVAKQNQSSGVFQAGIRLPIVSPDDFDGAIAAAAGSLIAYEQFEAFTPELLTMQAAGGFQLVNQQTDQNQLVWKTLFGGSFMKPDEGDSEIFGDVNSQLLFHTEYIRFGVGGILRAIITEDVDDRFSIQTGLSVLGDFGAVRPQIGVKLPLTNDLNEILDLTYSLGIGFDVGSVSE